MEFMFSEVLIRHWYFHFQEFSFAFWKRNKIAGSKRLTFFIPVSIVKSHSFDKFDKYIASARPMSVLIVVYNFFKILHMQLARNKIPKIPLKCFLKIFSVFFLQRKAAQRLRLIECIFGVQMDSFFGNKMMVPSILGTINTNFVNLFQSTDLTTSFNLQISQPIKKLKLTCNVYIYIYIYIYIYLYIYQIAHNFTFQAPHTPNLKKGPMALNSTKVYDTIDTEQDSNPHD